MGHVEVGAGLGGCGVYRARRMGVCRAGRMAVCGEASAELLEDFTLLRPEDAFASASLELPRTLMAGLTAQVMFKVGKWASLSHERFYHSVFVFAQFSLPGTFGRESQRAVLHTLALMPDGLSLRM